MPISWSKFHRMIKNWIFSKSTQNGLLKNVQDGISMPIGSREIQKTKVDTVLWDTQYHQTILRNDRWVHQWCHRIRKPRCVVSLQYNPYPYPYRKHCHSASSLLRVRIRNLHDDDSWIRDIIFQDEASLGVTKHKRSKGLA